MPIPVIRIPVEIDSRKAHKNLRDLRFQFNALEREAKSVCESLSSSIAAVQSGNLVSAAQASGLNDVASRNRGEVLFAAANAADVGSGIRGPKAPRAPKSGLDGNAFGPLTGLFAEKTGDLNFDTKKELRSALDDFRFNSGLIGEEFADRVRQAQKIALNINTTASLVLDEFSRIALTDFDLLKKPKELEAEAIAGIGRDLREEEDVRIRMGEDELARELFERKGKPLVESFRISRGFNSTLDDQLENTITRLEELQPFGRADENIMQSALDRLQDLREQSKGINNQIDDLENQQELLSGSLKNDPRIFQIDSAVKTLGILDDRINKQVQRIKSQLDEIKGLRLENDPDFDLGDEDDFVSLTGAIDDVTDGLTRFGEMQRENGRITEEVAFTTIGYGQTLNRLEAPLSGAAEGTGSLTAEVMKNRTAFDEMADSANRADISLGNVKVKSNETKTALEVLAESSDQLGQAMGNAFEDAVINGKDLRSVLRGLENDLLRILFKEFGVTGKGGIFSTIFKDVLGGLKPEKKGTFGTFENDVRVPGLDDIPGAGSFDVLGDSVAQLTARFGMASAGADLVSNALQTSAVDTLTAAAKTTLLGAAEQTASSAIFELAAAARVASAALNSVGASKGGGLGGLGGLFGGGEDFSAPFDSATDIAFGGPGFLDFAHGGRFTVRGPAGIDNLLTPLRLTAGERVTVETPDQQKANARPRNITVVMNITTPDAGGFRKSQNQIVADLQRALDRAKRIQ